MHTSSSTTAPSGVAAGSTTGPTFNLTLDENPLADFVELPDEALQGGLWFSNVLCGVLRGALEMVSLLLLMQVIHPSKVFTGANASGCHFCFRCLAWRRFDRDPGPVG